MVMKIMANSTGMTATKARARTGSMEKAKNKLPMLNMGAITIMRIPNNKTF